MKIAIVFLLVGLSSCFVAANPQGGNVSGGLQSCPGKITLPQGRILATMVVVLIHKYEQLKQRGMQNSPEKICLLDTAISIVKLVASYKQCNVNIIIQEVTDKPELAATINADISVLIRAVCCTADKLISADGFSLTIILNEILPDLVGLLGSLLTAVTNTLGSVLNVVFSVVNQAGKLVFSVTGLVGDLVSGLTGGSSGEGGLLNGVLGGNGLVSGLAGGSSGGGGLLNGVLGGNGLVSGLVGGSSGGGGLLNGVLGDNGLVSGLVGGSSGGGGLLNGVLGGNGLVSSLAGGSSGGGGLLSSLLGGLVGGNSGGGFLGNPRSSPTG